LRLAGYRALESLRLEKFYRAWGSDITANDNPFEAGLGGFVKLAKDLPFIGRKALEEAATRPLHKQLCGFTTEDRDIVLVGRETILRNGEFAGYLTSGGFGYTVDAPIGMGYVRNPQGVSDDWLSTGRYELVVANENVAATIHRSPLYDPAGLKVRGAPGSNSRPT
jgi:glycine cleavage system aminomethyltransferase T